jgi:hypothetical protein
MTALQGAVFLTNLLYELIILSMVFNKSTAMGNSPTVKFCAEVYRFLAAHQISTLDKYGQL